VASPRPVPPRRPPMPTAKKSRAGKKFAHGDDLTKTREDAKRTSSTQSWEKRGKKK